ncbi:hypothetical protein D9M71_755630 [compost metagenome]
MPGCARCSVARHRVLRNLDDLPQADDLAGIWGVVGNWPGDLLRLCEAPLVVTLIQHFVKSLWSVNQPPIVFRCETAFQLRT